MPASKAQQKAVSKYMKQNYDEIKIRVKKGHKAEIKSHADAIGESVNNFIGRAIDETMERDNQHMPISKGGYTLYEPEAAIPPYPPENE